MAKRKHPSKSQQASPPSPAIVASVSNGPSWSSLRHPLFWSGSLLLALGFYLITWTDPAGQNWPSLLSAVSLVVGYTALGFFFARFH